MKLVKLRALSKPLRSLREMKGKYLLCLLAVLSVSAVASSSGCRSTQPHPERPHHTLGGDFRNLNEAVNRRKSIFSFMWMRLKTKWVDVKEGRLVPRAQPNLKRIAQPKGDQVTWLGHSCFLIQVSRVNILTDPVFSERASPVSFAGPRRYTQPAMSIDELPLIHAVVISHNHYDHLDLESIEQIEARAQPLWFVPLKNGALLEDVGVPRDRIIELDWWGEREVRLGRDEVASRFIATPAQHWSARGLFDRNEMLWSSWAVKVEEVNVYFGGDTGYHEPTFKEIGARLGPFDLGLIPIGAYDPRSFMRQSHVNPDEALLIHQHVKARRSLGAHWGTFPLTAEPVMDPPQRLRKALSREGIHPQSFIAPTLGLTYQLDEREVWPSSTDL